MISLDRVSQQFNSDAAATGRTLFDRGSVKLDRTEANQIDATVSHRGNRFVTVRRDDFNVHYSCTCRSANCPCEHVFATMLAASKRRLLNDWPLDPVLVLDEDDSVPAPLGAAPPVKSLRAWKALVKQVQGAMKSEPVRHGVWPTNRQIVYVISVPRTLQGGGLSVEIKVRDQKPNGQWSKPKNRRLTRDEIAALPDPVDQSIVTTLIGSAEDIYYYSYVSEINTRFRLLRPADETLIPIMCRTGRLFLKPAADTQELYPMQWDEKPWELCLDVQRDAEQANYLLSGILRRGDEEMPLTQPIMLTAGGMVFTRQHISPLRDFGAFEWVPPLRTGKSITIPVDRGGELLDTMLNVPRLPRLDVPDELKFESVNVTPKPRLSLKPMRRDSWMPPMLAGQLTLDYAGQIIDPSTLTALYDSAARRLIVRDYHAEQTAHQRLLDLGFQTREVYFGGDTPKLQIPQDRLPVVVRALSAEGWHIEAEGTLYRQPGQLQMQVSSGIDWFELHATVQFGDHVATLPQLLSALRRGENMIRLGDGSFGIMPEDWLKKYGLLTSLGTAHEDHVRFSKAQVGLLDALLAAQPEAHFDEIFNEARLRLQNFAGIAAGEAPAGFCGTLRPYQNDGLGWLHFLRDFGFGGCLADDMGLGKTVQVLALLETRRQKHAADAANYSATTSPDPSNGQPVTRPHPTSVVVVPRSLVFNWKQEAAKFTPELRVLDHSGADRARSAPDPRSYDLMITTYGTLRRDITFLKDVAFDYVILDEAQAIKNSSSESSKAVRLLSGQNRLVLSGTPIQNHLGELWSLFEFLNPGMLGAAAVFQLTAQSSKTTDEASRKLLGHAIRPFVLRRTKEQVAKDLPAKSEQTIFCTLDKAQRKQYDELREHYRQSLLGRIATDGLNKSKIHILEALLRLRQCACHPGLIDKNLIKESSAKLETLMLQLREVIEEGHKALVFSQFTSLLSIVRDRLDHEKIVYEYLDGKTRDRQERVERFQGDPACPLFLISLKAGGLGLNLTAAEYVFLLDPWWNPAVEAQAIDRTHRIGQSRQVFAYRLIAQNTVEEKILQLQKTKRDLADSIIRADDSLIRTLTKDDLQLLLS